MLPSLAGKTILCFLIRIRLLLGTSMAFVKGHNAHFHSNSLYCSNIVFSRMPDSSPVGVVSSTVDSLATLKFFGYGVYTLLISSRSVFCL